MIGKIFRVFKKILDKNKTTATKCLKIFDIKKQRKSVAVNRNANFNLVPFAKWNNVFEAQAQYIDFDKYRNYIFHNTCSRPVMLIVETVNVCNNKCIICVYDKHKSKKTIMSLELFDKVLADYSKIGGGYLSLTPTLGEIFLDNFLVERLKLIDEYPNIKNPSFTTNAVMAKSLSDDDLSFILSKISVLHVSVYGMDHEEYFSMTKKNEYSDLLTSINRIISLSGDNCQIRFGFRSLKTYSHIDYADWISNNFGKNISFEYTSQYCNWGILDTTNKLPYEARWVVVNEHKTEQCLIPLLACQVSADGSVSFCPCNDFAKDDELYLGSIVTSSLCEIYNSEKVKKLWNFNEYVPLFCRRCSFYRPINCDDVGSACRNPLGFVGG